MPFEYECQTKNWKPNTGLCVDAVWAKTLIIDFLKWQFWSQNLKLNVNLAQVFVLMQFGRKKDWPHGKEIPDYKDELWLCPVMIIVMIIDITVIGIMITIKVVVLIITIIMALCAVMIMCLAQLKNRTIVNVLLFLKSSSKIMIATRRSYLSSPITVTPLPLTPRQYNTRDRHSFYIVSLCYPYPVLYM